ncbi:MAG: penicillin-binding transpeptidase domain-containing protein [Clostridia bacterium]
MKRKKAKRENTNRTKTRNRLVLLIGIFAIVTAALLVRIAYIQFFWAPDLQRMAYAQQSRDRTLSPSRGLILDRNGRVLATSVAVDTITISPNNVRNNEMPPEEIARKVASFLRIDHETVLSKISRNSEFEIITKKVDRQLGNALRKWVADNKISGIYIDEDTKRYYPNNNLASHVIGMTGIDNQGLGGIEYMMESHLKGIPGKIIDEIDVHGTELPFSTNTRIEAIPGHNVVLTIDETIQYIAEKAIAKAILENEVARGATAIVMDPRTGEILALVSKPDFNLNDPRACPPGYDISQWSGYTFGDVDLLNKTTWRNKAVSDLFEPGSTFKAFTAAMVLEENKIRLDSMTDDFTVKVQGHDISCWSDYPHGQQTFLMAMYNSCNPVFVKVAMDLGLDSFYKYIRLFGFRDRTGVMLPGEEQSIFHENPTVIDMAVASFGQRFEITPLQLITAYNAIANGGYLMEPRLVKELLDSQGNIVERYESNVLRQVISTQTSDTLREMLEGVVTTGTGKNAYVEGYSVAGKTGTSQTKEEDVYIASFCGFAPAENPLITVLVTLDDPRGHSYYGGVIAAPVVAQIIEEILQYMQVPRKGTEDNVRKEAGVPDLIGYSIDQALVHLNDSGLKYKIMGTSIGEDINIVYQYPEAGNIVYENSVVVLYTYQPDKSEVMVRMPNLRNKTVDEAMKILNGLGLNIRIEGNGTAISQKVTAGSDVERGSVVSVTFRHLDNVE